MVTCYVRYVLDPLKLRGFEIYAKMWIPRSFFRPVFS